MKSKKKKGPLIKMVPTLKIFGVVSRFLYSGGWQVCLSEVLVSVEWLFGDIINSLRFLDYKKNLKIGLSSVGKMNLVCALLRNATTCLYGNQTSEFFNLESQTLE